MHFLPAWYADIGYFKFDKEIHKKRKERLDSDSEEFAAEMWFARGFAMYAFQDQKVQKFLEDILNKKVENYPAYVMNCGFLDYYFCAQQNSFIYDDLLVKFNSDEIVANLGSFGKHRDCFY
ncbi:MAG: hypothetical protein ACI4PI_00665 [Oscillospiraceae bacterium]